jgi:hypothetical protein
MLLMGIGFIVPNLGFPTSVQAQPAATCSNATLHGTYVFSGAGFIGTASIPFAVSGLEVFNGNGTSSGFATTVIEGQPISRTTFTGTYTVNPNCTVTETDTDNLGNVMHFDEFTGSAGKTMTIIETDPNVVFTGVETLASGGQQQ